MASIDLVARAEDESPSQEVGGPKTRLAWDDSLAAVPLGFGPDAEPVVLDWFGRGEPDLLVTAFGPSGRTARVYRPRQGHGGAPPQFDAGRAVEGLHCLRCVCPIPNIGATRFDLVALEVNHENQRLVWLRNEGSEDQPVFRSRQALGSAADFGLGPCRIVQLVAFDWDGDGLADLLAGIDTLNEYWPRANRVPAAQRIGFNQEGGHPCYNRAGLWRGQAPQGQIYWLRNVGKPGEPAFALEGQILPESGHLELALHPAPLALSWHGAGTLEVLITDSREVVHIHRNFGGQRPPLFLDPMTLQCGHSPLLLPDDRTVVLAADLDGDGRDELVYGTADGRVFAVHAGRGRHEAKTPAPLVQDPAGLWLGGGSVVAAGDLDSDGDLDLVVGNAPGRLHYFQDLGRPGEHRYAAPVGVEAGGAAFRLDPGPDGMLDGPVAPRLGHACPALVDWSGHGRLDLIVSGAGGEVFCLRNDGAAHQPRFASPVPLRLNGRPLILPPRVRPAAADWSGTGQLDLIALDLQGFLVVFPRVGSYEVDAPIPVVDQLGRLVRLDGGYRQSGRAALWAGPFTGAAQCDILVGLPRGNRHVIPSLTGLPLDCADALPTVLLLEDCGDGSVVARPVYHADGRPLVVGYEGCSPSGVASAAAGSEDLDLLVGSDDGHPTLICRDLLRW